MKKYKEIASSKKFWIIILAALVVIAAIVIICSNLGGEKAMFRPDKSEVETIQSNYVEWSIPSECMNYLKYENETTNYNVADMFSMQVGSAEIPIFRFDFGDENAGEWLGLLTIGEEKIPVVYTVFMVSDEELAAIEGADEVYYMLMDAFNEMVKELSANKNFSAEKPIRVSGNEQEVELTYWAVTLPTEMSCHETYENDTYQVVFYCYIREEKIALYQVNIGDIIADSPLGQYRIDDKDKIVSITCYDIFNRTDWNEDDYALAYHFMDTINDVVDKITSSEYFSELESDE